jgi:hypothetical protein
MDPGAFICAESESADQNRDGNAVEIAKVLTLTQSMSIPLFWLRVALRSGRLLCDFMRARASNCMNGFLYNQRVRVRKEDHGWIGCCGSERCEF